MNIETLINWHKQRADLKHGSKLEQQFHQQAAEYLTELLADIRDLQVTEPDVAGAQLIKT